MPEALLSIYNLVMKVRHPNGGDVVMLGLDGLFAVCAVRNHVAAAYNYAAGDTSSQLCAPCSNEGLGELLDWTDRPTAQRRFRELSSDGLADSRTLRLVRP